MTWWCDTRWCDAMEWAGRRIRNFGYDRDLMYGEDGGLGPDGDPMGTWWGPDVYEARTRCMGRVEKRVVRVGAVLQDSIIPGTSSSCNSFLLFYFALRKTASIVRGWDCIFIHEYRATNSSSSLRPFVSVLLSLFHLIMLPWCCWSGTHGSKIYVGELVV